MTFADFPSLLTPRFASKNSDLICILTPMNEKLRHSAGQNCDAGVANSNSILNISKLIKFFKKIVSCSIFKKKKMENALNLRVVSTNK